MADKPPPYGSVMGGYPDSSYPQYPQQAAPYPPGPPYPFEAAPYPPAGAGPYAPAGAGPFPPAGAAYPSTPPMFLPVHPPVNTGNENNNEFARGSFSDKSIRHAFIRKVYLILTAQLLVTCGFICLFLFHQPTQRWVKTHSWFYYVSYAVFFVTYIALVCCPGVRRRYPGNFIALGIFTLAFSYMTATIASFYSYESVLITVAITTALCLTISLFAIQTRIDFTKCTALILVVSVVFFLTGLACMIVYMMGKHNRIMQAVYGGIGALVFSLYLAFDTQMIIGGRKHEMSPEDYIYGALQLYMDVVNMFLMLLSLVGSRD